VARSKDKLEKLSKELPGSAVFPADMSDEKAVKKMIGEVEGKFGGIDILINNAGRGYDSPVEFIDTAEYRKIFDLNVMGSLVAMQAVIPAMRKRGGGAIVNISSGTALMYIEEMGAYSSSKRALGGITLTARQELAKDKIAVSIVYPYITLTDFEKNTLRGKNIEAVPVEEMTKGRPPADTAQFVAEQILEVIKSGEPERYAHNWMKKTC
jgi:short-subunit dehydrogenase